MEQNFSKLIKEGTVNKTYSLIYANILTWDYVIAELVEQKKC